MLKRVIDFNASDRPRLYYLFNSGRIAKKFDDDGYVCVDTDELKAVKPKKAGRKPKPTENETASQNSKGLRRYRGRTSKII